MIPRTKEVGPQDRIEGHFCTKIFQDIQSYPRGKH